MSSIASRSGLLPISKRDSKPAKKTATVSDTDQLPKELEAMPIGLSLRPFGGLYNPYAKGCSVLCNHPAPVAVRDVINEVKTAVATENWTGMQHVKEKQDQCEDDSIPDDLFRRYTDTDSRPLTPTPTATSIYTLTSSMLVNNRRCITPEPRKTEIIKRKKLILDLRRTHSQETLYWKPTSELSQSVTLEASADGEIAVTETISADEKRATKCSRSALKSKKPKSSMHRSTSIKDAAVEEIAESAAPSCEKAEQTDNDDQAPQNGDNLRRRKKRKKTKAVAVNATTLRLREDPETQVATLGPDSLNPSTRPSLIPNSDSLLPRKEKQQCQSALLKGSFLTEDVFRVLTKDLDIDIIENTFDKYLNRALREAIKYIPPKPPQISTNEATEKLENLAFASSKKMPRKLSKSAARFDVPLDLNALEKMTPLQYLSKYVWVSSHHKTLYKSVFVNYLTQNAAKINHDGTTTESEENQQQNLPFHGTEYVERTMSLRYLTKALEDVLEFYGTDENISKILLVLDYENIKELEIDFRTWCGIASFAERVAQPEGNTTDSCDELEKVDFDSLIQRFEYFSINEKLREAFRIIRSAHFHLD